MKSRGWCLGLILWSSVVSAAVKPAVVSPFEVIAKELFDPLSYPARVVPESNAQLLAETDGVVVRIVSPLGTRLAKGQPVLAIRHTDPVYQYAAVQLRTPIPGVVSGLEVSEGSQVTRGQRLGTVTDPSRVYLSVEVPALDVASLAVGLEGEFRMQGRAEPVKARVRGISPWIDPASGTARAEVTLDQALAPGLVGQVRFKTRVRQGIEIPEDAVYYKGDDPHVRLIENGRIKLAAIKLGRKQRGQVEILTGLQAGARVVERSSRAIADGELVQEDAPAAKTGG